MPEYLPSLPLLFRRASRLFLLLLVVSAGSRSVFGQTSTSAVVPSTPTWVDAVTGLITIAQSTGNPVPTGTVTYSVDGGASGSSPLINGTAYLQLGQFAIGAHTLTSSYSGDGIYPASTPAPVNFNVVDQAFSFVSTESETSYDSELILGSSGIASDPHDTLFISNPDGNNILTVDSVGNLTPVPVTGLASPEGILFDDAGNLFIADHDNDRIVEYSAGGVQSALSIAGLGGPTQIALDRTRNLLFIADPDNQRVLRYDLVAGGAPVAVATGLTNLISITVDPSGNLYYSDKIQFYQRVDPSGNVTPIYVNVSYLGGYIGAIFADRKGFLYISDTGYGVTLRIDQQGHQTRIESGLAVDWFADDSQGRIYLNRGDRVDVIAPGLGNFPGFQAQSNNSSYNSVQYAMPQGQDTLTATFAPSPTYTSSDGGCPSFSTWGMCYSEFFVHAAVPGQILGGTVASIPGGGSISTPLYGNSVGSIAAFSPGTQTTSPTGATAASGVAYDQLGNYFASDATGNRVLETTAGSTTALAFSGLSHPTALAVDGLASVYVLDTGNNRVAKLDAAQNQTAPVVAGSGNPLSTITAFTIDGASEIYFAGGTSIYLYDHTGTTSLVASGLGTSVALALDPTGNLYTLQQDGSLIEIDIFGTQKTLAAAGSFANAIGLAVDSSMTAYVAQAGTPAVTLVHPDLTTFAIPVPSLGHAAGIALDGRGSILAVDSVTNQFTYVDRSHQDFNFGDVPVNTTKTFAAYLLNSGTAPSVVTGVPGDNNFHQVTTADACLTSPATTNIPSAGSCNLSYTVSPTTVGMLSGGGRVTTSDTVDFDSFSANAVGIATLTPDSTSLTLADTVVGSTSPAKVFTITNTGSAAAVISGVTLSDATNFSETDTCSGATVAVSATCTVTVTFHPTSANVTSTATILIASNASNPSLQLTISGHSTAAAAPQAMLAPSTLTFTTTIGTTAPKQTLTLSNGTAPLSISSIGFTGANASLFSQSNTCGSSLATGASCTIAATFTPASAGTFSVTLSVIDTVGTQTSALTGTGTAAPAPQAALSPTSANFGSVAVGSSSSSQTFTLKNAGNAPLTITSVALTGTNASSFAIGANACGSSLAAGANCTIAVTFAPSSVGSFTASLSVVDAVGTQTAALNGAGTAAPAAQAALTPATATFGSVIDGSSSAAQTFTLTNAGNAALAITSISLTGTNASSFALGANACGSSLAAGANCTIAVTFSPSSVGSFTASLSVVDAVGTQTAALNGTGTAAPAPQAALTPATANFGNVTDGSSSSAQIFTLTNAGTATLPVTSVAITGTNASEFVLGTNGCGSTLAAGGSCSISISFKPDATGSDTASLTVVDSVGTQTSSLTGAGAAAVTPDFSIAATPPTQTVGAGGTASYTVSITPSAGFDSAVALTATGLPPGATVTFTPASATPGNAAASSMMAIQTAASQTTSMNSVPAWRYAAPALAAVCFFLPFRRLRKWRGLLCALLFSTTLVALGGCGGGFGLGTAAKTATSYTVTVTGTSGSLTHSTTVQITVQTAGE
jgi:sugar lactone lactonase YvrE